MTISKTKQNVHIDEEILKHPQIIDVIVRELNAPQNLKPNATRDLWSAAVAYGETTDDESVEAVNHILTLAGAPNIKENYESGLRRCFRIKGLRHAIHKLFGIPAFEDSISLNTFRHWAEAGTGDVSLLLYISHIENRSPNDLCSCYLTTFLCF